MTTNEPLADSTARTVDTLHAEFCAWLIEGSFGRSESLSTRGSRFNTIRADCLQTQIRSVFKWVVDGQKDANPSMHASQSGTILCWNILQISSSLSHLVNWVIP